MPEPDIRDTLAAVIRAKYDTWDVDRYPTEGALAVHILADSRMAMVLLPEQDQLTGGGEPRWNFRHGGVSVTEPFNRQIDEDIPEVTIVLDPNFHWSVTDARKLAAAILAAARKAEGQSQ